MDPQVTSDPHSVSDTTSVAPADLGPPAWPLAGYSTVVTDVVEPGGTCPSPPPRSQTAPNHRGAHHHGSKSSRAEFPSHVSHLVGPDPMAPGDRTPSRKSA